MPIVTTDTQTIANEPVTLEQAKRQPPLRVDHALDDDLITDLIFQAREEAEWYSMRTLRLSVSREETFSTWPDKCIRFDHPPLIAVDAVKYFDADNAEQTLAGSNYLVQTPTEARGVLTWSSDPTVVLPDHYDRPDAIKVEYRTGYQTADEVPEVAKGAILMLVSALYDPEELQEAAAYRETAKRMLRQIDWGSYE